MHRTRLVAAAMSAGVILALSSAAAGAASPKPDSVTVALDGKSHPAQGVVEKAGPGGTVAATITTANGTARVSAGRGSTATVSTQTGATKKGAPSAAGGVDAAVTLPDVKGQDVMALAHQYRQQGRSVVLDAMATGMSFADAVAAFGDMDPQSTAALERAVAAGTPANDPTALAAASATTPSTATAAPASMRTTSSPDTSTAVMTATTSSPTLLDSACADASGDAGNATSHACVIRYIDYSSGGDMYFSHKEKVTAQDNDWWYSLDTAKVWAVYPSGNTVVDWDPYNTRSVGSCGTLSVGVTDPKTGVNVGYSGQVCPDKEGPVWTDSNRGYGAYWGGYSTDYEGAVATSVVHSPPSASMSMTVHTYIHWS